MYNPYLAYVEKYFPNAVSVVDSFHVVQWVIRAIDNYIRSLIRKYRQKIREAEERRTAELGYPVSLPQSDELYLLQKYRWLILLSKNNLTYHSAFRIDPHFHRLMNTYDYESSLFQISRGFGICVTEKNDISSSIPEAWHPLRAMEKIEDLINFYIKTGYVIFARFANLLLRFRYSLLQT